MNELTKYGQFMYNLCMKFTKFIVKHRILYYILACTWGCIMTFLGFAIFLLLFLFEFPDHYYWIPFFEIGKSWGGFEMGLMFVRDKTSTEHVNAHEFGHTFQNCVLGPFMPVLVSIPSAIRYWYREIRGRLGKPNTTSYDSIWFERSATDCGRYAVSQLRTEKLKTESKK